MCFSIPSGGASSVSRRTNGPIGGVEQQSAGARGVASRDLGMLGQWRGDGSAEVGPIGEFERRSGFLGRGVIREPQHHDGQLDMGRRCATLWRLRCVGIRRAVAREPAESVEHPLSGHADDGHDAGGVGDRAGLPEIVQRRTELRRVGDERPTSGCPRARCRPATTAGSGCFARRSKTCRRRACSGRRRYRRSHSLLRARIPRKPPRSPVATPPVDRSRSGLRSSEAPSPRRVAIVSSSRYPIAVLVPV